MKLKDLMIEATKAKKAPAEYKFDLDAAVESTLITNKGQFIRTAELDEDASLSEEMNFLKKVLKPAFLSYAKSKNIENDDQLSEAIWSWNESRRDYSPD